MAGVYLSLERAQDEAESLTCEAQAEGDNWKYVARKCEASELAQIDVYDETGEFLGTL